MKLARAKLEGGIPGEPARSTSRHSRRCWRCRARSPRSTSQMQGRAGRDPQVRRARRYRSARADRGAAAGKSSTRPSRRCSTCRARNIRYSIRQARGRHQPLALRRAAAAPEGSRRGGRRAASTTSRWSTRRRSRCCPYKPSLNRSISMGLAIGLLVGPHGRVAARAPRRLDPLRRGRRERDRRRGARRRCRSFKAPSPDRVASPCSPTRGSDLAIRRGVPFGAHGAAVLDFHAGARAASWSRAASKNEGKSTTALALAINFAQMGKPVLIIDADLRNPVLHKTAAAWTTRGACSNYLSGNDRCARGRATAPTFPNLFVMTTGPLPPNPVELLSGMKLLTLLSQCEEHFAHVIVDGPPVHRHRRFDRAVQPGRERGLRDRIRARRARGTRRRR